MADTPFDFTDEDYARYLQRSAPFVGDGPLRPEGTSFFAAMMSTPLPENVLEYLRERCV